LFRKGNTLVTGTRFFASLSAHLDIFLEANPPVQG
jgi:hypothetical protein